MRISIGIESRCIGSKRSKYFTLTMYPSVSQSSVSSSNGFGSENALVSATLLDDNFWL